MRGFSSHLCLRGSSDHNDSGECGLHSEDGRNATVQFIDRVVNVPVTAHRQTPVIQKVQKTVEVPQIHFIDKFADAPVNVQAEGKKRKLPLPAEGKTFFMNTASGDEAEDEGETYAHVHVSLCDGAALETRSEGEHKGSDSQAGRRHPAGNEGHVRELIGVLVRKGRCAETRAEIAARRLDRLEREQDEQDDKEREAYLQEALGDKTEVVKHVIDMWFVDRGFGFGKVPAGETVFIHASVVHGREVLMVGTNAWVQVVNDEARAEGGYRARNAWGRNAWKEEKDREKANRVARQAALTAELVAHSEKKVAVVCDHPPGLRGTTTINLIDETLNFFVKATGKDEASMRQQLTSQKRGELRRSRDHWKARAEDEERFQKMKEEAWRLFERQPGFKRKTREG